MKTWTVTCPQCNTPRQIPATDVKVTCGLVSCTCVCDNCNQKFSDEQPYWRWLKLERQPPLEPELMER